MSDPVSREEFLQWVKRLDAIDATGTRGVAVLAVQMQELAKDFSRHEERHDRQDSNRVANRKWLFASAIAVIAAIDGPIVTIFYARGGR